MNNFYAWSTTYNEKHFSKVSREQYDFYSTCASNFGEFWLWTVELIDCVEQKQHNLVPDNQAGIVELISCLNLRWNNA